MEKGYLVLEDGSVFTGVLSGQGARAGEVVFNTSHSGYEEMATDPSYLRQILICTAPMQGNYGESDEVWESESVSIHGFICLELQNSQRDSSWKEKLTKNNVPILTRLDTRELTLYLREKGTIWGAITSAKSEDDAKEIAKELIAKEKAQPLDWVFDASVKEAYEVTGHVSKGPRVAILDFGTKKNIVRELSSRCSRLKIFPSRTSVEEIMNWSPDGVMLTNGPGDPASVEGAVETVKELLGKKPIFGICMGHQILSLALGGSTYKLKFGHRGSNHPIKDYLLNETYVTSQNHGYAVDAGSLPETVQVTHINLNDQSVAGVMDEKKLCFGVQFHPESCPGPHDAVSLFDHFLKMMR